MIWVASSSEDTSCQNCLGILSEEGLLYICWVGGGQRGGLKFKMKRKQNNMFEPAGPASQPRIPAVWVVRTASLEAGSNDNWWQAFCEDDTDRHESSAGVALVMQI